MRYLTEKDIIRINVKLIKTLSVGEIIGVKDPAALNMLVKQPSQSTFGEELYPTIYDKAAILAINIAKRHPFHNANKRTALVAMVTFLKVNGIHVNFTQEEAVSFILKITMWNGVFDDLKDEVAAYLETANKTDS